MPKKKSTNAFDKIRAGLEDALAYHRDRKILTAREVRLPPPPRSIRAPEVLALRKMLGVSQAVFAGMLNVSRRTVQAWEIGARQPSDAALRLLHIAKKHPKIFLEETVRE